MVIQVPKLPVPSIGSPFRPARRPAFVAFDRIALEGSIPGRFEAQATAHPGRLAIGFRGAAWSYESLDRSANRVARALPPFPGPVLLLIEQGPALVAAILGVLKAGGCYLPLEVFHAPKLVQAVVGETCAPLALADAAGAALVREAGVGIAVLEVGEVLAGRGPDERLARSIPADAPASLYYTSGSTGRPKGVVATHAGVLHNIMRYTNSLGIDRDDRLTLLQSPSFSGAASSLFGALLNGAAVFPYDVRRDGTAGLGEWLIRERITIYHSVPALFRLAARGGAGFPDLRLIRLEGDQMSHRDWRLFRERFSAGSTLVNGFGLTECGLIRQFFINHATPITDGVVPVGYPVEDMEVEVVDEAGRPVEVGEVGEIAVRGDYIARGYHGRPELTERAFAADPDAGVRRYRTGDLGRLHPDGRLDYLGRNDARLKIHGEWVDVAEVEAVLVGAPGVLEAAARIHGGPGEEPRLVGYVVSGDGAVLSTGALRTYLAARLPARSVPAAFVTLSRLPLTENGKVKRAALPPPPPPERPELDARFVAPQTAMEQVIAGIWSEVLGVKGIGIEDNFFDLGGDSLMLSQVHGRLQARLGGELPVPVLYEHLTIGALARHLCLTARIPVD